uniref:uncharacterized protein isoform X3 n=1 Tax=Myxine glutinosa TaxID=7769 RepID=UPI00358F4C78
MVSVINSVETSHEDMIHDAQMDYYGNRLATCSSDRTVKIFNIRDGAQTLVAHLHGHDGPVWQVAWAHAMYGSVLASCAYDRKVIIWQEGRNEWEKMHEYKGHDSSGDSVEGIHRRAMGLCERCKQGGRLQSSPKYLKLHLVPIEVAIVCQIGGFTVKCLVFFSPTFALISGITLHWNCPIGFECYFQKHSPLKIEGPRLLDRGTNVTLCLHHEPCSSVNAIKCEVRLWNSITVTSGPYTLSLRCNDVVLCTIECNPMVQAAERFPSKDCALYCLMLYLQSTRIVCHSILPSGHT